MAKKIFIIAGEASGDLLGSKVIRELKLELEKKGEQGEFIGIGGKLMKEQGLTSIFPMEELSVMGFLEVLPHIPKLLRRIKQTAEVIKSEKPDHIITIDSPDFCFRVAKKLQDLDKNVKKTHLIAPSVWAYREGRAQKIAKLYDLLLAILPFEPPYFEKYGLKTVFIGHPICEDAPDFSKKKEENSKFRKNHEIDSDAILISITPGSRIGEVKNIFPEFIGAVNILAKKRKDIHVVITTVEKTKTLVEEMAQLLDVKYSLIPSKEKSSALFSTNYALAKSGTNTLEFSLYKIPMIIAYKVNYVSYFLAKMMIKIKFANLVNLVLNREIIPEMLQQKCNAKDISEVLNKMIEDKKFSQNQVTQSLEALKIMGLNDRNPAQRAAEEILK